MSRSLDRMLGSAVSGSRALAIALGVAAAVAIMRIATLSIFIGDVSRAGFCVTPGDEFRSRHSCMAAYAESVRFVHEGSHNIYDRELYIPNGVPREVGPLRVDPFHYPPPFLLLPQAVRAIAPDFWNFRDSRVNFSAYGQTVRLRQLGISWLTQPRGLMLTQVYGLAVIALAIWAGWRRRFDLARTEDRIALLLVSLGLLGLAQFRSPFVAATYGSVTMLWTLTICAARASTGRDATLWLLALYGLGTASWAVPSPGQPSSVAWIWISGALVTICMAISAWAVIAGVRSGSVEAMTSRDGVAARVPL